MSDREHGPEATPRGRDSAWSRTPLHSVLFGAVVAALVGLGEVIRHVPGGGIIGWLLFFAATLALLDHLFYRTVRWVTRKRV